MASNSAYGASAAEIAELFADYLEGNSSRPTIVLSRGPLADIARAALEKSFAAFGYPPDACTYATLYPKDPDVEGGDIGLDPQAVFMLVEGLDPVHVVSADELATQTLSRAYRADFPVNASIRVFGRQSVSFADLSALLETERGKQEAWALLKTLPVSR